MSLAVSVVRQPSRRPGAPLGLASLDLVFGEAALAADLIMQLDLQGSPRSPAVRMSSRRPLAPLDSWILVFGEAALAADLITD